MRNVEVKAIIKDLDYINKRIEEMKLGEPRIINQHDIFYKIPQGRLKMRKFEDNSGELIYYERSDIEGPKLSSYNKATISSSSLEDLSTVLKRALGSQGEVKKTRRLYMLDQTRIHIDYVEDLGDYMELEVVLLPNQSIEDGEEIASSIMKQLNIGKEDFIASAYVDLLLSNKK
ncbi:hypothetical protein HHI36_011537 [Cryptolaemus montrouzieri]|uniref:CYTH domain-containing protein n=1 Tax=Cryptolaemus montrouzieri TaxID=559131 RepID=A0ABD2MLY9_9CUCU